MLRSWCPLDLSRYVFAVDLCFLTPRLLFLWLVGTARLGRLGRLIGRLLLLLLDVFLIRRACVTLVTLGLSPLLLTTCTTCPTLLGSRFTRLVTYRSGQLSRPHPSTVLVTRVLSWHRGAVNMIPELLRTCVDRLLLLSATVTLYSLCIGRCTKSTCLNAPSINLVLVILQLAVGILVPAKRQRFGACALVVTRLIVPRTTGRKVRRPSVAYLLTDMPLLATRTTCLTIRPLRPMGCLFIRLLAVPLNIGLDSSLLLRTISVGTDVKLNVPKAHV